MLFDYGTMVTCEISFADAAKPRIHRSCHEGAAKAEVEKEIKAGLQHNPIPILTFNLKRARLRLRYSPRNEARVYPSLGGPLD